MRVPRARAVRVQYDVGRVSTGPPTAQHLQSSERFGFALYDQHTFVAVFRGRCRTSDVTSLREQLTRWLRKREPANCRVLVLIENRATLGQKGRSEIGHMLRERAGLRAWANVVEGTGFWASAVRGITTTLLLVSKPAFPLKTFASVSDAAEWLCDGIPSTALPLFVEELRRRVGSTVV